MEAHQLFATIFGAIFSFDQYFHGVVAHGRFNLHGAKSDCAGPTREPEQVKATPRQSRLNLVR